MTPTLPRVTHEHHERLSRHVDQMPGIGDQIGTVPLIELRPRIDELASFLRGLLVPHMEAAEGALYPELERLLQNRHSMTPMRREHAAIRRLIDDLERLRTDLDDERRSMPDAVVILPDSTLETMRV